jgi:D-galactarolactone isomerase
MSKRNLKRILSLHDFEAEVKAGIKNEVLPPKACDCHMHVFDSIYPSIPNASLRPKDALLDDYRTVQRSLGCERFVIVQPSIYGTDNSLLLKTLQNAGEQTARGVAIVDDTASDALLAELYSVGVRGARFNQVQNGATTVGMLTSLDERLHTHGFHVQFYAEPATLLESEQTLLNLKSTVVIDHIARLATCSELRSRTEAAIRRLLSSGKVWLKLSAPYLAAGDSTNFDMIDEYVHELLCTFPKRLIWGTDWPHATESREIDNRAMLQFFLDLMPSAGVAQRVFVENPERLYGFSSAFG